MCQFPGTNLLPEHSQLASGSRDLFPKLLELSLSLEQKTTQMYCLRQIELDEIHHMLQATSGRAGFKGV